MAKFWRYTSATATACLFVFLLLFLGARGGVVDEKRSCESKSHKFKGKCLSDTNCGTVCHTEGFQGGECRGFRQRCFCTRPC